MGGSVRFYSVHLVLTGILQACLCFALSLPSKRVVAAYALLTFVGLEEPGD